MEPWAERVYRRAGLAYLRAIRAAAKAVSALPRSAITACGAILAGIAVILALTAGGVPAHSSVTAGSGQARAPGVIPRAKVIALPSGKVMVTSDAGAECGADTGFLRFVRNRGPSTRAAAKSSNAAGG